MFVSLLHSLHANNGSVKGNKTILKIRSSLYTAALLALSTLPAHASPTVEGMTILLPNDGWYQVQDSESFEQICAGVSSCEVTAGNYIVINHSTGERFENVVVSGGATPSDSSIVVDANRISWPDDGWYQVQNAETFESICEGGRSCVVVDNGTYTVINHSTGERFNHIVVSSDQAPFVVSDLRFERYSSSAIELFWSHPASGESAEGYSISQDGVFLRNVSGTSLFLSDLPDTVEYQFAVSVNGEAQSDSVTVPVDSDAPLALTAANAESLLANIVSVINEEAIDAFYQTAIDDDLFRGKFFGVTGDAADQIQNAGSPTLETPYSIELTYGQENFVLANAANDYVCTAGGALTAYFNTASAVSNWVFDECVVSSNTYSGTAGDRLIVRGNINTSPVYNLSIEGSDGQFRSLSGGYSSGNRSFVVVNAESNWDAAFYSGPVDGGQLEISDYSVSRTNVNDENSIGRENTTLDDGTVVSLNDYTVSNSVVGAFSVSAPWSQNQSLSVVVDLAFTDEVSIATDVETGDVVEHSGSDQEEAFYWQSGFITVAAEDGSIYFVEPVDGQPGSFRITTSNGETVGPVTLVVNP